MKEEGRVKDGERLTSVNAGVASAKFTPVKPNRFSLLEQVPDWGIAENTP